MDVFYALFPAAWPHWLRVVLGAAVPAIILVTFMALGPILYVYAERKISGFMQDRLGPMRVGPYGLLQTIADAIKLLFKEAIYPAGVDRALFLLAPCLVVIGAFLSFVVVPWGPNLIPADLDVGLFYVIAVSSLATVGLIMAGWASNNKYALFGAMRSAAQIVSYEIPAVLSLLAVVMIVGSLSLQQVVEAQRGGLPHWFLFRYFPIMLVVFLVFFIATLAECNRTPFDIPEAESELVAGYHTEYSGFFFAMFFMAEYTEMFIVSAVASVLFLGGWHSPLPPSWTAAIPWDLGPLWLLAKAWGLVFVHMWLRWTLPRLRVDQLMHVAWKVLLPIALGSTIVVGGLVLWPATSNGFPWDPFAAVAVSVAVAAGLVQGFIAARRYEARRLKEGAA